MIRLPNIRWLLRLITRTHGTLYKASGGRIGHRMAGADMLLLTCVGRRSGVERVTPLLYARHGDHFLVAASNAGDDRPPAWWLNLQAKPEASVQAERRRVVVLARRATAEESERFWPLLEASYPHFPSYREGTQREIPVVILQPQPGEGGRV